MTDCDPPRCFRAKERCQCPNSWIEYLSKEAKDRQRSGLPRLSIKRHATNYRKLKRSGIFKTSKPTKECRDIDTDNLCQWNSQRRPSTRESSEDLKAFLQLKDPSIKDMAGEPSIKTGVFRGVPVIIKIENVGGGRDDTKKKAFLYTTKVHSLITERIPHSVPRLYKAYFLRSPSGLRGVHIMERLPGVMMDRYTKRARYDLPSLARVLKRLLNDLRSCKVLHGDLGPHNIILDLDKQEKVISAKAIDFESTCIVDGVPNGNADILLEEVFGDPPMIPPALISEMLKVDRSLPREMKDWRSYEFERLADAARESCIKRYDELPSLETFYLNTDGL